MSATKFSIPPEKWSEKTEQIRHFEENLKNVLCVFHDELMMLLRLIAYMIFVATLRNLITSTLIKRNDFYAILISCDFKFSLLGRKY